jgi:putative transposase
MKKTHVQLKETEQIELEKVVSQGELPVRVLKRALALLALNRGESLTQVALHHQMTHETVSALRNKYKSEGLACLYDKPRSGRPPQIDGLQRAQITALACSEAPQGHAQWSLRLLAGRIVELGYCDSISHTQVGEILKKTR